MFRINDDDDDDSAYLQTAVICYDAVVAILTHIKLLNSAVRVCIRFTNSVVAVVIIQLTASSSSALWIDCNYTDSDLFHPLHTSVLMLVLPVSFLLLVFIWHSSVNSDVSSNRYLVSVVCRRS